MKVKTDDFIKKCNCRSVGECMCNMFAGLNALDKCISQFSKELRKKLQKKYTEGKSGWDDPDWTITDIKSQLISHVAKGDMIDVAAFAMFAWNKGNV